MPDVAVAIARTEAASHVNPNEPLEDRFRAAMAATWQHWMLTNEDEQFRAAIEAVYLSATDDERERIEEESRALRDLSALLSGVAIDFDRMITPENPIGLRALWMEVQRSWLTAVASAGRRSSRRSPSSNTRSRRA